MYEVNVKILKLKPLVNFLIFTKKYLVGLIIKAVEPILGPGQWQQCNSFTLFFSIVEKRRIHACICVTSVVVGILALIHHKNT
jgi:hypothetical protein